MRSEKARALALHSFPPFRSGLRRHRPRSAIAAWWPVRSTKRADGFGLRAHRSGRDGRGNALSSAGVAHNRRGFGVIISAPPGLDRRQRLSLGESNASDAELARQQPRKLGPCRSRPRCRERPPSSSTVDGNAPAAGTDDNHAERRRAGRMVSISMMHTRFGRGDDAAARATLVPHELPAAPLPTSMASQPLGPCHGPIGFVGCPEGVVLRIDDDLGSEKRCDVAAPGSSLPSPLVDSGSRSYPSLSAPSTSSGYIGTSLYASALEREQAHLWTVAVGDDQLVVMGHSGQRLDGACDVVPLDCVASKGGHDSHRCQSFVRIVEVASRP